MNRTGLKLWKTWDYGGGCPAVKQEKFSPFLRRMMSEKGITDLVEAKEFFYPSLNLLADPFLMQGMEEAVAVLGEALAAGEKIVVFGDYDVDGITSAALLASALRKAGAVCSVHVPEREEGYGLSEKFLAGIDPSEKHLLITTDCGIKSSGIIREFAGSNLRFIVTDHHLPEDNTEFFCPVLNPMLEEECAWSSLSGAGVAFKLVHGLYRKLYGERALEEASVFLDLAAMGIIADLVPLLGEARVLASEGLKKLNENLRPGVSALIRSSGLEEGGITADDIAYQIAPRINSCGRIGRAADALELLLEENPDAAAEKAEKISLLNEKRREIDRIITDEAETMVDMEDDFLLVAGDSWPSGVLGIVASRLCEKYGKPAIVLTEDRENGISKGSGRSWRGYDITAGLQRSERILLRYGGHRGAAGLTLRSSDVEALREILNSDYREYLAENPQVALEEIFSFDPVAEGMDSLDQTGGELALLAPFGMGNPEPLFSLWNREDVSFRPVGKNGEHLRLSLDFAGEKVFGIFFGGGKRDIPLTGHSGISMLCRIKENNWKGSRSMQLVVDDIRIGCFKPSGIRVSPFFETWTDGFTVLNLEKNRLKKYNLTIADRYGADVREMLADASDRDIPVLSVMEEYSSVDITGPAGSGGTGSMYIVDPIAFHFFASCPDFFCGMDVFICFSRSELVFFGEALEKTYAGRESLGSIYRALRSRTADRGVFSWDDAAGICAESGLPYWGRNHFRQVLEVFSELNFIEWSLTQSGFTVRFNGKTEQNRLENSVAYSFLLEEKERMVDRINETEKILSVLLEA